MQFQRVKRENPTGSGASTAEHGSFGHVRDVAWRRSYDKEDPRAQVSSIHWEPTAKNENALKFFDTFKATVWDYSDHIRQAGKPLRISANTMTVLRALLRFMDGKTGCCDPCLDTIASRSRLSVRTVVRQLAVLRRERIIDWVRRTAKTGHAPGEGPQRKQISNSYCIDIARLPIEIARTLRQKLGDKLREATRKLVGSGPVPSRLASQAAKLLANVANGLSANGSRERAERRTLAGATTSDRLAHMYRNDPDGLRQHEEMLGLPSSPSASAKVALYPSHRTKG